MVARPCVVMLLEGCVQTGVDSDLKIGNIRGYVIYSGEDLEISPLSSREDILAEYLVSLWYPGAAWGGDREGRMGGCCCQMTARAQTTELTAGNTARARYYFILSTILYSTLSRYCGLEVLVHDTVNYTVNYNVENIMFTILNTIVCTILLTTHHQTSRNVKQKT